MGRLKNRLFGMYGSFVTVGRVCYKKKLVWYLWRSKFKSLTKITKLDIAIVLSNLVGSTIRVVKHPGLNNLVSGSEIGPGNMQD